MPLEMKYFVLTPEAKTHDDSFAIAACDALYVYADSIQDEDPELAHDLREWADIAVIKREQLKEL